MNCIECGRPWGVFGEDHDELRQLVAEWFADWWAFADERPYDDYRPRQGPPPPFTPDVYAIEVVFVSEASGAWLSEYIGVDTICEAPCWQEAGELPAWWVKSRRPKKALRVDCCDLDRLARNASKAA